jgi:hypothetical protein
LFSEVFAGMDRAAHVGHCSMVIDNLDVHRAR